MKHSLRIKITAAFIGLFTLATVVVLLINHFWLPQYYVKVKMQTLKTCMEKLETAKDASQFTDSLARYCGVNNLTLAVTDERLSPLYMVASGSEGKTLPGKIFGYYSGEDSGQKEILESTDRYVIQQTADMFTQIPYMEIWGQLENKNYPNPPGEHPGERRHLQPLLRVRGVGDGPGGRGVRLVFNQEAYPSSDGAYGSVPEDGSPGF